TPISSSLLFSHSVHHRHLPSFPTRRSSDLANGFCRVSETIIRSSRPHQISGFSAVRCGHGIRAAVFSIERIGHGAVAEIKVLTRDRKSTRLNSSHVSISYAVFCLKKKKRSR